MVRTSTRRTVRVRLRCNWQRSIIIPKRRSCSPREYTIDRRQREHREAVKASVAATLHLEGSTNCMAIPEKRVIAFAFNLRSKPFHFARILLISGYKADRITETYS